MNSPAPKQRRPIRPLPERLINKIAAGEVIERPAAVVKELVENSLDAGATRVDIIIEKSGSKLIHIIDNGSGIDPEQIEIAFSRHATSKISEFRDLDCITSYGFRGEALPSIASVSRMRMVSRPADSDLGMEIIYEGGVLQTKQPVSAPPGTQVEVENLFFNTPARRKFLKSESTEARQISRIATGMALGRYPVGFSYRLNGRDIFTLPSDQQLGDRVAGLLSPGKKFLAVSGEAGPVRIEGCIGLPDMVQSNRYGQFLFLNGRYIQSPTLAHAFVSGYGELVPRGKFPIGALLLTIEPTEVDVNVHPAKTEVRLSREREVYSAIYHLVGDALRHDGIIPAFRPAGHARPSAGRGGSTSDYQSPSPHAPHIIPGVRNQAPPEASFLSKLYKSSGPSPDIQSPDIIRVDKRTGEIVEPEEDTDRVGVSADSNITGKIAEAEHPAEFDPVEVSADNLRLVGRFSDLYLLLQSGDDLLIVDQHTAHERVLYEQMMRKVDAHTVVGQHLLLPVQIELSPEQFALFEEVSELLNNSGFAIAAFGGRMVNIETVPSILATKSPEKMVFNVLDDLASMRKGGFDLKKAMAQSMACRAAVMSGDRLSEQEARGLVSALLACDNPYSCPHGRPTFIKITRNDLNKQFGRG